MMNLSSIRLKALTGLLAGGLLTTPAVAQWTTAQLAQARTNLVAASAGGKVFFAGGSHHRDIYSRYDFSDAVDVFDAATLARTTLQLSQPRGYLAAASAGGKVFFAGGYPDVGYSDAVDVFDAATLARTTLRLSRPRTNLAAASAGGKVFFAGGITTGFVTSDVVDVYDLASGTWTVARLSQPRSELAAASAGGKVFFGGGRGPGGASSDVVDIYDSATGTWTVAHLSQARVELVATSAGGRVFFAGGTTTGFAMSDVVDVYDVANDVWSTAKLAGPRGMLTATSAGGKAFFAGGWPFSASNVVDVFDTKTFTRSLELLSVGRLHLASASANGKAFFGGGLSNTYELAAVVDVYDPQAGTPSIAEHPTPANQTVCPGGTAATTIAAEGPLTDYQWFKGADNEQTGTPVPGQTGPTLTLTHVQPADAGLYFCRVRGQTTAWSAEFRLTVGQPAVAFGFQTNAGTALTGLSGTQAPAAACAGSGPGLTLTALTVGASAYPVGLLETRTPLTGSLTLGGTPLTALANRLIAPAEAATLTSTQAFAAHGVLGGSGTFSYALTPFADQNRNGTYEPEADCTLPTTTLLVTVTASPTAFAVTGGGTACGAIGIGLPVGLGGSEVGVSYQLQRDGAPVGSPLAGTGGPLSFGRQTTPGTYTVEATAAGAPCSAPMAGSAAVAVDPAPGPASLAASYPGLGAVCAGQVVGVVVTLGCVNPNGTALAAQLSDAGGSFSAPLNLGPVVPGSNSVALPASLPGGGGYRVRVVGSDPALTSAASDPFAVRALGALGVGTPTTPGRACLGQAVSVTFGTTGSCPFPLGNVFTVQLSSATGSFANPTTLGTALVGTSTLALPAGLAAGSGYRVRVVSSNPAATSAASVPLRVEGPSLSGVTPTVGGVPVCRGGEVAVSFSSPTGGCPFPAGNAFTAQLSSATGSFNNPTTLGPVQPGLANGLTIPASVAAGSGYRIRLVSSNPALTSSNSAPFQVKACASRLSAEEPELVVLPNPVSGGEIRCRVTGLDNPQFSLTTTTGQGVRFWEKTDGSGAWVLTPKPTLPAGVYLLQARQDGVRLTRRVLVGE